jgi:proteasome lid subunit RPN8/RPN11
MIKLSRADFDRIIAHGRAALPNEACGLIAGEIIAEQKIIRALYCLDNADHSPEHFSMTSEDQFAAIKDIRAKGFTLLGNFHSHPATPARPSQEDIRLAFDPALSYLILSLKDNEPLLKSFIIKDGGASEETLEISG